jgi:hypothetical protein
MRTALLSLALVIAGLIGFLPSAEASIDDFIKVYKQIESAAPPGTLPVTSAEIVAYKDLFTCAEGGGDIVVCANSFHKTSAGQQASDQADIPEGVWQGVEAYVAWKDGDTWGVVEHLGAAAACAVLQVLAGGTDVCGLIQDLYDAAVKAYDTAKWVVNFFKSVGEGTWNTVKAIGCTLHLGGCDDDPPPPPAEVTAFNQFFAPAVKDGSALKARESKNPNAFGTLVNTLSSAAQKKFSLPVVAKAAGAFTEDVNKLWNSDIASNVLPALAAKRDAYNNAQKAQNVGAAVKDAADAYAASKTDPMQRVVKHCTDDFAEFAHFDYWQAKPEFQALWKQLGSSPSTATWCSQVFWYKNKETFTKSFHDYVAVNFCPTYGQQLLCPALPKYEVCLALMGSVGQKNQCGVTIAKAGKEAAQKVDQALHTDGSGAKGSTIPCQIVADSTPLSSKPAELICPRPVQQYYCNEAYKTLFGSLPAKLVECKLGTTEAAYGTLVSQVQTAVGTIPKSHPKFPASVLMKDQIDPLIVHVGNPELFEELQKENQSFGFGPPSSKPGFDYSVGPAQRSKDGVNTPVLTADKKPQIAVEKKKFSPVMQPDPATRSKQIDPTGKLTTQDWNQAATAPSAIAKAPTVAPPAPTTAARDTNQALIQKINQLTQRIKSLERGATPCGECGGFTKRAEDLRRRVSMSSGTAQATKLTLEADKLAGEIGRVESTRGVPAVQDPKPAERSLTAPTTR